MCAMDSRRLVVWISTGILGFQGATLAFDLLNCTALSWLYVRTNGLAGVGWWIRMRRRNPRLKPGLSTPWLCSAPAPRAGSTMR